jgi:hypothetical protein
MKVYLELVISMLLLRSRLRLSATMLPRCCLDVERHYVSERRSCSRRLHNNQLSNKMLLRYDVGVYAA